MKRILLTAIMVCFIIGMTSQAQAFDGNRKGFILGLGLGYGQSTFAVSAYDITVSTSYSGFCSDFRIGYAPSEQVMLYWNSKVAWITEFDDLITYGLGGLGGAYYLKPEGPSFYFTGLIGFSSLTNISEASSSETGSGMGIGAGYEFSNHYSVEANYVFGSIEGLDVSGIRFTFNALAF
jgi:opacity protein-like surface antigen